MFKKSGIIIIIVTVVIGGFAQDASSSEQIGQYQQDAPPQGGPFNDEVFGAVSSDGINFKVLAGPFFQHASVPDVLELRSDCKAGTKGTLFLYFVDFSELTGPGSEGISMAASSDGLSWSEKTKITITGKVNKGAAVDPSVVQLTDGRIRLYFFGSEMIEGDPARHPGDHNIYSAISDDGINFEIEPGVRFSAAFITDPEVVRTDDEWLMFLSHGEQTLLARSNDGLDFTLDNNFDLGIGGVPGAVVLSNGKVRIFATGRDGIRSALFDPGTGYAPVTEAGNRVDRGTAAIVADPAALIRSDGTHYLIFKKKP